MPETVRHYWRKGMLSGLKGKDGRIRFSANDIATFRHLGEPFFEPGELNVAQAARALEVQPETIRRYRRNGRLIGRQDQQGRLWFKIIDVDMFKRWAKPAFGPKPSNSPMEAARVAIRKPDLGLDAEASLMVGRMALFDELQRPGTVRDEVVWARLSPSRKESLMLVRALTLAGAGPKAIASMLGMSTRWIQMLTKQYNAVVRVAPPESIGGADRLFWDIPRDESDDRALQDE